MKKLILGILFSICSFIVFSQEQQNVKTIPFQAWDNKVNMNVPSGWQKNVLKESTDQIVVSEKSIKDINTLTEGIVISREIGLSKKLNLTNSDANLSQGIILARKAEYEKMAEYELKSEKPFTSGLYTGIIQEIKYRKNPSDPLMQAFVLTYVHNDEAIYVKLISSHEAFNEKRDLFWGIIRTISIN
ncbi:MAG TPA: hypothetical protein VNA26_08535 [Chitinophagaceae bacterium]|nr:hypothetical protein [Chitinophagaceae bacterium]